MALGTEHPDVYTQQYVHPLFPIMYVLLTISESCSPVSFHLPNVTGQLMNLACHRLVVPGCAVLPPEGPAELLF